MSEGLAERSGAPAEMVDRVRERLGSLAEIGKVEQDGVTRLAYTQAERDAHALFAEWARAAGAQSETDDAGNTIATYREGTPYFLIGSHLDTVISGGRYDGAAGVVAGIEVAELVAADAGAGVRVVAFAGEEGARFGRPNLGSAIAAGLMSADAFERLIDADGVSLASAAERLGLTPLKTPVWLARDIACFFEVHIEQGRQLEAGAARIGLVDAIAGSVRLRFTVRGRADHSGATPMRMRSDALAAASELVLATEEAGRRYRSTVATVGRLQVQPNNVTTVPGSVTLWIDIRDVDADLQRLAARTILERAEEISRRRGVTLSFEVISEQQPVVLEAWPRMLAHHQCTAHGVVYRVLASGAGHDAAIVARHAPASMVFVPCVDGVSHSPREQADPEDVALAAVLLADVLRGSSKIMPYNHI
jgi:allantoate deiminase